MVLLEIVSTPPGSLAYTPLSTSAMLHLPEIRHVNINFTPLSRNQSSEKENEKERKESDRYQSISLANTLPAPEIPLLSKCQGCTSFSHISQANMEYSMPFKTAL